MRKIAGSLLFSYASKCTNLQEAIELLKEVTGDDAVKATVAFGMLLSANSTKGGEYRNDALEVLNQLAYAKAKLDSSMCHTFPTIKVTHDILYSAQVYADENTIPCTEWPTSDEIINIVLETAKKYTEVKEWKKLVKDERGAIIGVEPV